MDRIGLRILIIGALTINVATFGCSQSNSPRVMKPIWTDYAINAGVFAIAFQDTSVWVGTDRGLIHYDLIGDRVAQVYDSQSGLGSDTVTVAKVDSQGNVWAGTHGGGLSRFDGKQWQHFDFPDLADPYVYDILFDRENRMWVANWKGVSIYDGQHWHSYTKEDGIVDDWVYALTIDDDGIIWMGTEGGVTRYDGKTFVSYSHKDGVGADRKIIGVYRTIPNPSFHHQNTEGKEAGGYNPNYILAAAVDHKNVKWFGTWGAGLSRFDGKTWKNYTVKDGLPGNFISDILVDREGVLWIATDGGIGEFKDNRWGKWTRGQEMGDEHVFAAAVDEQGFKWFGTIRGVSKLGGFIPNG